MSVAFRRESDEEHLEPKFERPIPAAANLVTARGLALIAERIAALDAALATAAGDDAEKIRRDLRYWHTRRTTAAPTLPPADGSAGFGTVVEVRMNGRVRRIALVGDDEADPASDRLAYSAPLARALMAAEPGDVLPFGEREDAIMVLSVTPIDG
ncbi:GreA/GreB family elongation factor [Sphingomonas bacterium]|uniref:GreA/GreB family elongation factor n=1 Tax=Sphingomonas bacterium TaxID=1895847 RepID=UPI001576E368|nr:GreA/GreB family elongation factor [Sphingomonas bacterium]